jgi:hypothetical protein
MKKYKKFSFVLFFLAASLCVALPVLAVELVNPLGVKDLPTLIGRVIKAILGVVGSIALLMFIYGGFLWLTSAGSVQKVDSGKKVITWAVIGLVVIFLSYTMVNFVIKGITGKQQTSSTTQADLNEMMCCYASCENGTAVNPTLMEAGSCTTKLMMSPINGSCPSNGGACQ